MQAKRIDGKQVCIHLREELARDVSSLKERGISPKIAVLIAGDDPASLVYSHNKRKACEQLGIESEEFIFPYNVSQDSLIARVKELNERNDVHGILVEMPLPTHIDESKVIASISPEKDVDAFHMQNVGRLIIGTYCLLPCTPAAIMKLIESTDVTIEGKECVVVGRSGIVGKPVAMLLMQRGGTVTICHTYTKDLSKITRRADILVVAIGQARMITAEYVKPGAVVIDVGINRTDDGKICGDVDYEDVSNVAGYITPVPGGVGPMTITMLLRNTVDAADPNVRIARKDILPY